MKPVIKSLNSADVNMTSFQGSFDATYAAVVAVFGEPQEADEYKVAYEWIVEFKDGTVSTIYDWKETSLYDESLPPPSALKDGRVVNWHIGGHNRASVIPVLQLMGMA